MAWMEGTYEETRSLPLSAEAAAAYFADPAAIVAATKAVEQTTVEGETIHFVLQEEDHGVVKFKPDYRCTYTREGTTVRWNPSGGNIEQTGTATFTPKGDGCEVHYSESLRLDLPVSSMMTPMLRPLLGPVLAKEIKGYLDRMVANLPTG